MRISDWSSDVCSSDLPHIAALTRDIGWPISLTTHVGSSMVIRDSTHAQTSLTFNAYYPGYAVPLLDCAATHVYLAYAREEEPESLPASHARLGDRCTPHLLQHVRAGGVTETVPPAG